MVITYIVLIKKKGWLKNCCLVLMLCMEKSNMCIVLVTLGY